MEITMRAVDSMRPYERNAKKHDEAQIANVARSIDKYGWRQPIVIDRDGVIVIGHCRWLAAKKLGQAEVPVVMADDVTDEEIRELRIIDNKTNESPWDVDILNEDASGLNFDGFTFTFDNEREIVEGGADAGEIEDNTAQPVAVTIRFQDVRVWRNHEADVREMIDGIDGASVSVGGAYEDQ